ncbi:conjugative transfer protein MobI(A/C) [Thiomicrospira sp. S5]|uniref:conjugative transfer protein MobI(A/C) n=1 Tax=Thiomicrospira sp. S5 TaxID=1803865 RepID=UPI0004A6C1AB|nr:conjugative transfer protein MobI(A/C) [Thiomicrospira sp. S5]AZR82806.1 hypothetical protein AYJ59_11275 [Thiomicrospira sp. S5]
MHLKNIELMREALKSEYGDIETRANMLSELFWEHRSDMVENKVSEQLPLLGCRVHKSNGALRMNWFYYRFYKDSSQKTRRTNIHIKKGQKSNMYSLDKLFAKCLSNEKDLVKHVETEFAKLRERLKVIQNIKRNLTLYEKALGRVN